ncbi:precorrin-6A synthase (deacetylating) [Natronospirillum operosum]|uniref:Precorrin-6A synthase (Deacetylating) n=1 Tax=Natronospirillum operosum TaxID=2759953 RepID=A0A4Z0W745_9GAMM|nr:precorrin-6A synthase (deacetylating) [Natronospirillum operosum]TGG93864.1 precorrin-6A synthase (deacetylating) [Natronospirillum operosum]
MIHLCLIGIGTGNPDHVTREGERRLNEADLILLPRKGDAKSDLVDLRRTLCDQLLTRDSPTKVVEFDLPQREEKEKSAEKGSEKATYLEVVEDWHDTIAARWGELIDQHLPQGGRVALMIWGDPSLYDSSLRIADRLERAGRKMKLEVVPGITSLQALTAAHRIPLNRLAEPVVITTGRRLRDHGWPQGADTLVVMLDSGGAFEVLNAEHYHIWWGAYLGMPHQHLIEGPLKEVGSDILRERARLREQHGWIMDTYLLRRQPRL